MSETKIIRIATQIHGRIMVREASESPAPILVGFHGYGENGDGFLEAVDKIPDIAGWHVATIQALHSFYDPKTGAVVASWMTSQDRDLAISDNITYVTTAIEQVRMHVDHRPPTAFIGFSQGTAMAYRAACSPNLQCDGLIALAGDVPADVEEPSTEPIPRVLIGRGKNDTWYDDPKLETDIARLTRMGSVVETCVFDGGHEWTDSFRAAAGVFLASIIPGADRKQAEH